MSNYDTNVYVFHNYDFLAYNLDLLSWFDFLFHNYDILSRIYLFISIMIYQSMIFVCGRKGLP